MPENDLPVSPKIDPDATKPEVTEQVVAAPTPEKTKVNSTSRETPKGKEKLLDGKTILVVDDEPQLRRLLSTILKNGGSQVVTLEDSSQALAMTDEALAGIDALVTDYKMPGHPTGVDLAKAIKTRKPELPIVIATGLHVNDAKKDLSTAGLSDIKVLEKPNQTLRELVPVLGKLLGPQQVTEVQSDTREDIKIVTEE